MPKGVEKNSLAAAGTAQGQAANAYDTVSPIYMDEATHPQGYTPQQLANFNTAAQQSGGGGVSAATGQGNLVAARTGNIGGQFAAIDDASRAAAANQGSEALQVQNQNANLMEKQKQEGLAGLSGIYSDANSTGLGYEKNALDAANSNPWMKILLQSMQSAGQVGAAAAGG